MNLKQQIFDPHMWTFNHYLVFCLSLLALNLLGPRGWVHHYYIKQEIKVTTQKIEAETRSLAQRREVLLRLKKSSKLKERLLREQLGLLKDNEWSIEFYPSANLASILVPSASVPFLSGAQKNKTLRRRF